MSDQELLELAAKAARINVGWIGGYQTGDSLYLKGERTPDNSPFWNPLLMDGDALRLYVKLKIIVTFTDNHVCAGQRGGPYTDEVFEALPFKLQEESELRLVRRAIVRAAAEIGKAMS